jgi:hypothetical protein
MGAEKGRAADKGECMGDMFHGVIPAQAGIQGEVLGWPKTWSGFPPARE